MNEERTILQFLRWDVDQQIVNHEGEHVWLRACLNDRGERTGITDCCGVGYECAHHAEVLTARLAAAAEEDTND